MKYAALTLLYLLCLAPASAASQPERTDGLVSRWDFDPRYLEGVRLSASVGTLDATIVGPAKFRSPPPALILDGDSKARHRVELAADLVDVPLPPQAITVEAWVQIDRPQDWGGIIGAIQDNGDYERGWLLGFRNSQFCFAPASEPTGRLTYLTASRSFEPGFWYHVVGTYDGREQRIFVDGQLQGRSRQQSGPIAYATNAPYTAGAYHDQNELYAMKGCLQQISVWERALSEAEVRERFASRSAQFPEILAIAPQVEDWPTYCRDNQRTAISEQPLEFPLQLQWVHQVRHPPCPAWPDPAKQDYWHEQYDLSPRVTYDRAFHVVTAGDRVYFASSADDKVTCLDARTGRELWSFFTEGPVRLAPTLAEDRVLFGSDDGCVYCVGAMHGELVWKHRAVADDRRIAGNGRVISLWPVRTGVLVEGQVAYFCAGIFPNQGVFQVAVDLATGGELARQALQVSPQGYLERRSGRLFAATGRDPAGSFVAGLERRAKGVGKEVRSIPDEFPYAFIGAGPARIGGGDGRVAAFAVEDGAELWTASVEGRAYSLATARGRVLVSTDRGFVYCFSAAAEAGERVEPPAPRVCGYRSEQEQRQVSERAERILKSSGVRQGYCLVLGSGEGELLYELAVRSQLKLIGIEAREELVTRSRRMLDAAGLYGRAVVQQLDPADELPYTDYLFNLVVCGSDAGDLGFDEAGGEAFRVLRPEGGVALLNPDTEQVLRRGPLDGAGQWTHMYGDPANTACSGDPLVGGPMQLQWFGRPGPRNMVDRHHRTVAPLVRNGRLFVPGDDRVIGVDAYNGTVLWDVPIPNSRRVAAFRDSSYMAAGESQLLVAAAGQCLGLDVETGRQVRVYPVPPAANGEPRGWGFVATVDGMVYGSATKLQAVRREQSRRMDTTETYWDRIPVVCGEELFAFAEDGAEPEWTYRPRAGLILHPSLAIGDDQLFFVESRNCTAEQREHGRASLPDLLGQGADLVAVDTNTGQVLWRQREEFRAEHILYTCYAAGKVVVVGSRNSGTDRNTSRVLYDIHVFDADDGASVWTHTQDQGTKINGDHGEQDHHPLIVGDRLICEPFAYQLHTGQPLDDWGWVKKHRRGCGNLSASASSLFYRQSHPAMFDLATNQAANITCVSRPGCWINMIPAAGLLLIPEASSGCTCDFPVQTSLAFLPRSAGPSAGRSD